jgi:hypothetical protein
MHEHYDAKFYAELEEQAETSSLPVLTPVFKAFPHLDVVDIGCGMGHWLKSAKKLGALTVRGYDGDWVPRDKLVIEPEEFVATDLSDPRSEAYDPGVGSFGVPQVFSMAICCETAEHLPLNIGPILVKTLVWRAPVVVFSAATPGQGGTAHVNEQPLEYWERLFAKHGYMMLDIIRPVIAGNKSVQEWYRNNSVVFVQRGFLDTQSA